MAKRRYADLSLPSVMICIFVLAVSSCMSGPSNSSSPSCGEPLSDQDKQKALSFLSFNVPMDWAEIKSNEGYSTGPSLLTVFVFDAKQSTAKGCLDWMMQAASFNTTFDSVSSESLEMTTTQEETLIVVAEGHSNSEEKTPFKGVYASFAAGEWVYVFAWDSYGETANAAIYDAALFTLNSIAVK